MILFLYMHCLIKQAPKNWDRDGLSDKTAPQSPCKLPAVTADGESIACVDVPCLVTVHYKGLMHYCKGSCTSSGKMGLTARMLMGRLSWPCFCSHLLSPRGPKKTRGGQKGAGQTWLRGHLLAASHVLLSPTRGFQVLGWTRCFPHVSAPAPCTAVFLGHTDVSVQYY